MRHRQYPVRRREGRRRLRPQNALATGTGTPDPPLRFRNQPRHRPGHRHSRARHGNQRADDGLDHGHLLHDAGPYRSRRRDGQAGRDRRFGRTQRRDGARHRLHRPARRCAEFGHGNARACASPCRASATWAAWRRVSSTRWARKSWPSAMRWAGCTTRTAWTFPPCASAPTATAR